MAKKSPQEKAEFYANRALSALDRLSRVKGLTEAEISKIETTVAAENFRAAAKLKGGGGVPKFTLGDAGETETPGKD